MTLLAEEEAISAVTGSIRRLFAVVTERQARDLARAVLRDLAGLGLGLATTAAPQPGDEGTTPDTPLAPPAAK